MSKENNNTTGTVIAVILIIIGSVFFSLYAGSFSYTFEDTACTIDAKGWKDLTITYADIESIELHDSYEAGRRKMGFGTAKIGMGHFLNAEFGDYTLYAFLKCDKLIVLHMKDGSVIALNGEDEAATQELYGKFTGLLH